ncbi:hypothetical protein Tco_0883031 [Tanacetum coccineum]
MADLAFVNQHNMVAYLEKSDENAEFHQIVNFLSTCSIDYALTAVVISESSVRNDLLFDDEDGITCLTNDEIFENLALIGQSKGFLGKVTPLFDSMLVQNHAPEGEAHIEQILPSPSTYHRKYKKTQKHKRAKKVTELPQTSVPLDLGADEAIHTEGGDSVEMAITTDASLVAAHDSGSPKHQETMGGAPAQTRSEKVIEKPNEPPFLEGHTSGSREGDMEHTFELMDTVPPTPHDSPLTGGACLGEREGCTSCVDPQTKAKSQKIRKKEEVKHLTPKKEDIQADSDFDVLDDDMEDVEGETVHAATTRVSAVSALVTTAGVAISTVVPKTPPTTATTAFIDKDLTIAQTLVKMRSEKAKVKGVSFRDVEETPRLTRLTTTLQPLLTIDPKDKGKGVLVKEEPEKPEKVKRKDQGLAQIESDAELVQRLHEEELAELDKTQKEKQKQEEATNAALAEEFDEIQAKMDADDELAVRLTHEEQEKYTIEENTLKEERNNWQQKEQRQ